MVEKGMHPILNFAPPYFIRRWQSSSGWWTSITKTVKSITEFPFHATSSFDFSKCQRS